MRDEQGSHSFNAPFDSGFLLRLQKLQICAKRIFSGRFAALHISRKLGTGNDFADHRAYSPGDDLRLLDWNVYARSERLYTKLYHQQEDRRVHFLLDVSSSMAVEIHKFDYARKLTAAIAFIALYELDRVYLASFADGLGTRLPMLRGRAMAMRALAFLDRLRAGGKTDFLKLSHEFLSAFRAKRGLVIIVSDFLDTTGLQAALDVFFGQGFEVLAIQVVTDRELNPRLLGEWRMVNPEGGKPHTVFFTRRVLARYEMEFAKHNKMLRQHLLARRGGYVKAITSVPLEEMVLSHLRAGHLLG